MKIYYFLMTVLIIQATSAAQHNALVRYGTPAQNVVVHPTSHIFGQGLLHDIVHYPLSYALTGGLTTAGLLCKNNWVRAAMALGVAWWHHRAFNAWWALKADLNVLYSEHATGTALVRRNKWDVFSRDQAGAQRPVAICDTGYDIWQSYATQNVQNQKALRDSLVQQSGRNDAITLVQELKKALNILEAECAVYAAHTNIFYKLAKSVGMNTQKELLTSDYLLEHDTRIELKTEFDRHTQAGLIARIISLRLDGATALNIPCPHLYDWSYNTASACVWETLIQYGRLKAIIKICCEVPGNVDPARYDVRIR